MSDDGASSEAARKDAVAYAAHYAERNLAMALRLHRKIIASHASAREERYSRIPIGNIVNVVVPEQALLDAQMELALARLHRQISADSELIPVARVAPAERRGLAKE